MTENMQHKYEAFITEVNLKKRDDKIPIFDTIYGVHFTMYAHTKKEAAEKMEEIISSITNTKVTHHIEPYLSSVLEWYFVTDRFDINIGIETMS